MDSREGFYILVVGCLVGLGMISALLRRDRLREERDRRSDPDRAPAGPTTAPPPVRTERADEPGAGSSE